LTSPVFYAEKLYQVIDVCLLISVVASWFKAI